VTRCLLYARQSIEKDDGERSLSIDSQITVLTERCQRDGWVVAGVIRESGLKGFMDTDERPGLAEAIRRGEAGDYDTLLVWDLSRLARSLRLQEHWVWQFDRMGIAVVSHTEPESTNVLMRQIKGAFNEHRTREIAAHVRRALRENTRRGVPHGSAPYGYSRGEGKVLTPNAHAATVVDIFRQRAEGCSLVDIAAALRRDGIPGPTGGPWFRTTLTQLLANPVYRGTLHLAELDVPNAHPAIIDAALWQQAQDVARSRPRAPRTKARRSWLEGLILHACGHPMYLVGGSAGAPTPAFRCRVGGGWAHPDAICTAQPRQIAADRAEALAWDAVRAALERLPLSPRRAIDEAEAAYRQAMPAADASVRQAIGRRKAAAARRDRAIEMYLAGDIDRGRFEAESTRAASELAEAETALAHLPAEPDAAAIAAAWAALRELRDVLEVAGDEHKAMLLRRIGHAVLAPAGHRVASHRRGPRPDAGMITIQFRPELAAFDSQ
jgi:site-specific DNA recombinase